MIKNAIIASDGFSVCIGIAQICLIADLIITLQFFDTMGNERDSVHDQNNAYCIEQEERANKKRNILNVLVALAITTVLMEIIMRFAEDTSYPYIIFNCELLIVGFFLLLVTMKFNKLTSNVFEGDFQDEQNYFKRSLIIFLSTYALRATLLAVCLLLLETWYDFFENYPVTAAVI